MVDDAVELAARTMRDTGVGYVLVLRDGRPIGIVTDRDLVVRVVAQGQAPDCVRVGDVATWDPITVSLAEGIETAASRMREHGVRRLPIVDAAEQVVGIVTADDLLILLGNEIGAVSEAILNPSDAVDSR
jgi:CBS domain-containing protein